MWFLATGLWLLLLGMVLEAVITAPAATHKRRLALKVVTIMSAYMFAGCAFAAFHQTHVIDAVCWLVFAGIAGIIAGIGVYGWSTCLHRDSNP